LWPKNNQHDGNSYDGILDYNAVVPRVDTSFKITVPSGNTENRHHDHLVKIWEEFKSNIVNHSSSSTVSTSRTFEDSSFIKRIKSFDEGGDDVSLKHAVGFPVLSSSSGALNNISKQRCLDDDGGTSDRQYLCWKTLLETNRGGWNDVHGKFCPTSKQ